MKKWIGAVCCVAILGVGIVYWVYELPKRRVSPASFEKLSQGMTEAAVEAIWGPPTKSENCSAYSVVKMVRGPKGCRGFRVIKTNTWIGTDRVIVVDFGEKATAESISMRPLEEWAELEGVDTRSVLEKLCDWLTSSEQPHELD